MTRFFQFRSSSKTVASGIVETDYKLRGSNRLDIAYAETRNDLYIYPSKTENAGTSGKKVGLFLWLHWLESDYCI